MYKKLPSDDVATWLSKLDDSYRQVCLLTGNGEGWGTFLAWNPAAEFVYRHGNGNGSRKATDFVARQTGLGRKVIGYISYDLGYELHDITQTAHDDLGLPDIYLLAFDNYLRVAPDSTTVYYKDESFLEAATSLQSKKPRTSAARLTSPFQPVMSRGAYDQAYDQIKRYITAGDIYQANLTHRLEAATEASSRDVFARILQGTTSSFMAYIEGSGFAIHSASPERFVKIGDGRIETLPIKGTRPRGATPGEDEALKRELLASAKDAAELNMITDLLRNDLGKVCQTGSVKVAAAREILTAPNVFHTYSRAIGQLRPDVRPLEALLSMSPGGSITGCPKKRAMEIIDELEPVTRSAYCGSAVVVDPDGHLDSSILIRTIIQKGKRLILPVGGGIIHKSEGGQEYQETLDKAKALIDALQGGQ